jgi:hypothetical protein
VNALIGAHRIGVIEDAHGVRAQGVNRRSAERAARSSGGLTETSAHSAATQRARVPDQIEVQAFVQMRSPTKPGGHSDSSHGRRIADLYAMPSTPVEIVPSNHELIRSNP